MFDNIVKNAAKKGITAKVYNFQSGYYYDGKDNGYIYPCIIFCCDNKNQDLSNFIDIVCSIAKRNKLIKIDSVLHHDYAFMRYTTKEHNEKAKQAYSKSICFQHGFFMARYNNKNATDEELIKAGQDELIQHGYTI